MDYSVCYVAVFSVLTTTMTAGGSSQQWLTDNFLLVADTNLNMILQFDLATQSSTFNISSNTTTQPKALAFDPLNKTVYWTSGTAAAAVYRYHIDSGQTEVFYSNKTDTERSVSSGRAVTGGELVSLMAYGTCGRTYFDKSSMISYGGMAIDDRERKLYLTDEENGMVLELPLNITDVRPRIIDSDRWSKPRGIVVDSVNRLLYWADANPECAAIYRANITEGVKTAVLTGQGIRKPQALAINFKNQRLYWVDDSLVPFSVSLNGSLRTIRQSNESTESFGLAVSSFYMYLSDWQSKQLEILTLIGDHVTLISLAQPSGIVVYNSTDAALINTGQYDIPRLKRQPGNVCRSTTSTAESATSSAYQELTSEWTAIAAIAGGCGLVLVTCAILVGCCTSRRKRTTSSDANYDDARSNPVRYSRYIQTCAPTAPLLPPPPPPPMRPTPEDDGNDDEYLEPTLVVMRDPQAGTFQLGSDAAYYNTGEEHEEYMTLRQGAGASQPAASAVGRTYDTLRRSRMLTNTTTTANGRAPNISLYDDCNSVQPNCE